MIRYVLWMLAFGLSLFLGDALGDESRNSRAIIAQYLDEPLPEDASDPFDANGVDRVLTLMQLTERPPEEAIGAISAALESEQEVVHRVELLEVLRRIQTPGAADLFVRHLNDPDAKVRAQAVHGLHVLTSRIDRKGLRIPPTPQFPPKVSGLVPQLVKALHDQDELNRISVLFALADSRDSLAFDQLHHALQDPSPRVRLTAACLLTETGDDSGLSELVQVLGGMARKDHNVTWYMDAEMLLISLERVTGVSLGGVPGNPGLYSCAADGDKAATKLDALVEQWAEWWSEHPEGIH